MESRLLSLPLEIRLNIAGDTEIHPLHSLNLPVLRTPLVYDRNS
jgi:hypothetical protein